MNEQQIRADIVARLGTAMYAAVGLPATDIDSVRSLINAGELLEAFDTLCTQIDEWGIRLEPAIIRDLEGVGVALGARRELTNYLWENAADA